MIPFNVIVRACGRPDLLRKTLRSVHEQKIHRLCTVFMDGRDEKVKEVSFLHPFVNFIDTYRSDLDGHLGVAGAMYRALFYTVNLLPETVIVLLDGDGDTLPKDALARVTHVYEKYPDTLVTYGSYKKKSKGDRTKISQPYPAGAHVRKHPWRASHLKTFRASLLPYVKPEWFQDSKGKWLQAASDVALMLPLMELAGLDRCRHIHEITYVWNDSPVSRAKRELQKRCEAIVRAKPREKRLP